MGIVQDVSRSPKKLAKISILVLGLLTALYGAEERGV